MHLELRAPALGLPVCLADNQSGIAKHNDVESANRQGNFGRMN